MSELNQSLNLDQMYIYLVWLGLSLVGLAIVSLMVSKNARAKVRINKGE